MHVQHIYLVPLQQVVKCIAANPLDKLPLGFVMAMHCSQLIATGGTSNPGKLASFQKKGSTR